MTGKHYIHTNPFVNNPLAARASGQELMSVPAYLFIHPFILQFIHILIS